MTLPTAAEAAIPANSAVAGLTSDEAAARLNQDGPNELSKQFGTPWWRTLLGQFESPVVWLLLGACVVSALLGEIVDALAIGTIVALSALVGFFQEYRAQNAVLALHAEVA